MIDVRDENDTVLVNSDVLEAEVIVELLDLVTKVRGLSVGQRVDGQRPDVSHTTDAARWLVLVVDVIETEPQHSKPVSTGLFLGELVLAAHIVEKRIDVVVVRSNGIPVLKRVIDGAVDDDTGKRVTVVPADVVDRRLCVELLGVDLVSSSCVVLPDGLLVGIESLSGDVAAAYIGPNCVEKQPVVEVIGTTAAVVRHGLLRVVYRGRGY